MFNIQCDLSASQITFDENEDDEYQTVLRRAYGERYAQQATWSANASP